MRTSTTTISLENVDVECTHCGVKMSGHLGSGATIRYFHCPGCHRWVSSTYSEVLRADAKVRARPQNDSGFFASFDQVKDRLERWLSALDDHDPYKALGCSPLDTAERIRERYRELAILNHPDRGGSLDKMRAINDAYERISQHRERRQAEMLGRQLPSSS